MVIGCRRSFLSMNAAGGYRVFPEDGRLPKDTWWDSSMNSRGWADHRRCGDDSNAIDGAILICEECARRQHLIW